MSVEGKIDWMLLEDLQLSVYHEMQSNRLVVEVINYLSKKYDNLPKFYVIETVNEYIEAERKIKWCEKQGHKWECTSYGGPESGGESGYCKKCGFSFDYIMY